MIRHTRSFMDRTALVGRLTPLLKTAENGLNIEGSGRAYDLSVFVPDGLGPHEDRYPVSASMLNKQFSLSRVAVVHGLDDRAFVATQECALCLAMHKKVIGTMSADDFVPVVPG